MFIVRFVRVDHKPDEVYYYNRLDEALYHFDLFKEDDSCLYSRIEVQDQGTGKIIQVIVFIVEEGNADEKS